MPPDGAANRRLPAGVADRRPPTHAGSGDDADPETVARRILLRSLSAQPRTRAELAVTLSKRGVPEAAAQRVLDRFEEVGLIDDAAFARAWVETRHRGRGLARRALGHELRQRGVADETARAALDRLDPETELRVAHDIVRRKLAGTAGLQPQVRLRRLAALLARRGYPPGVAMAVVREELAARGFRVESSPEPAD